MVLVVVITQFVLPDIVGDYSIIADFCNRRILDMEFLINELLINWLNNEIFYLYFFCITIF